MPPETPSSRALRARIAAHVSWARTEDPSARTAAARKAFSDRFTKQSCPDEQPPSPDCHRRAEHLRKAYFTRLALLSAKARARRSGK